MGRHALFCRRLVESSGWMQAARCSSRGLNSLAVSCNTARSLRDGLSPTGPEGELASSTVTPPHHARPHTMRRFSSGSGAEPLNTEFTDRQSTSLPPLPYFYADWAEVKLPDKHRFPMDKYKATRMLLEADPSLRGLIEVIPSPLSSMQDVFTVHDPDYAQNYLTGQLSELHMKTIGFPWSPATVKRTLASTGGTIAAMHAVVGGGAPMAAQLAGGTHHAFADKGEGFCVFNDIAVAAAVALRTYGEAAVAPILVLDLDVHQGNGTASIFEKDTRVVTFDTFGDSNYPWRTRTESTYNVPLPDTTGDAEYLAVLDKWLPLLFAQHQPKLVFFQAGVDALAVDRFGKLQMTPAGMMERNLRVYRECIRHGAPLVITMGGGYSVPMDASVAAHADVYKSAALEYQEVLRNQRGS